MKNVFNFSFVIMLCLLILNGCAPKENGDNLTGFCNRMNTYEESYSMTPDGYIFDGTENSYTRFFVFGDKTDLMLQFKVDDKSRIRQMNIAFTPQKSIDESECYPFIIDCITAFCHDEKATNELIEKIDLESIFTTVALKTKSAEHGKLSVKADTTEIGTVISLYNNNYN